MKLGITEIQEALARAEVQPDQQEKVLNHLQEVIKELEAEKEQQNPAPKIKNEFGVIILDENGEIKIDTAALLYQIPCGEDHNTVFDRLRAAVKEFNLTKKGQKNPITSVLDAFHTIAPKIFKSNGLIRKSKDLVRVIKTNGKI